jgi:HK97 family phage prohead protease
MAVIERRIGTRERRFSTSPVAARRQAGSRGAEPRQDAKTIEGYGALFNSETIIEMAFREVILPGAFADSVKNDDIRVAFNHDANFILGRTSAKTATVEEDTRGLKYTVTPPDTRIDVVTSIKRGDITGSSFSFTVERDVDEEWDFSPMEQGQLPHRTIKRARLFEVGPVAFPAYKDTTVNANSQARYDVPLEDLARALELDELELLLTHGRHMPARSKVSLDVLERELYLDFEALALSHPTTRYEGPMGVLHRELDLLELDAGCRR